MSEVTSRLDREIEQLKSLARQKSDEILRTKRRFLEENNIGDTSTTHASTSPPRRPEALRQQDAGEAPPTFRASSRGTITASVRILNDEEDEDSYQRLLRAAAAQDQDHLQKASPNFGGKDEEDVGDGIMQSINDVSPTTVTSTSLGLGAGGVLARAAASSSIPDESLVTAILARPDGGTAAVDGSSGGRRGPPAITLSERIRSRSRSSAGARSDPTSGAAGGSSVLHARPWSPAGTAAKQAVTKERAGRGSSSPPRSPAFADSRRRFTDSPYSKRVQRSPSPNSSFVPSSRTHRPGHQRQHSPDTSRSSPLLRGSAVRIHSHAASLLHGRSTTSSRSRSLSPANGAAASRRPPAYLRFSGSPIRAQAEIATERVSRVRDRRDRFEKDCARLLAENRRGSWAQKWSEEVDGTGSSRTLRLREQMAERAYLFQEELREQKSHFGARERHLLEELEALKKTNHCLAKAAMDPKLLNGMWRQSNHIAAREGLRNAVGRSGGATSPGGAVAFLGAAASEVFVPPLTMSSAGSLQEPATVGTTTTSGATTAGAGTAPGGHSSAEGAATARKAPFATGGVIRPPATTTPKSKAAGGSTGNTIATPAAPRPPSTSPAPATTTPDGTTIFFERLQQEIASVREQQEALRSQHARDLEQQAKVHARLHEEAEKRWRRESEQREKRHAEEKERLVADTREQIETLQRGWQEDIRSSVSLVGGERERERWRTAVEEEVARARSEMDAALREMDGRHRRELRAALEEQRRALEAEGELLRKTREREKRRDERMLADESSRRGGRRRSSRTRGSCREEDDGEQGRGASLMSSSSSSVVETTEEVQLSSPALEPRDGQQPPSSEKTRRSRRVAGDAISARSCQQQAPVPASSSSSSALEQQLRALLSETASGAPPSRPRRSLAIAESASVVQIDPAASSLEPQAQRTRTNHQELAANDDGYAGASSGLWMKSTTTSGGGGASAAPLGAPPASRIAELLRVPPHAGEDAVLEAVEDMRQVLEHCITSTDTAAGATAEGSTAQQSAGTSRALRAAPSSTSNQGQVGGLKRDSSAAATGRGTSTSAGRGLSKKEKSDALVQRLQGLLHPLVLRTDPTDSRSTARLSAVSRWIHREAQAAEETRSKAKGATSSSQPSMAVPPAIFPIHTTTPNNPDRKKKSENLLQQEDKVADDVSASSSSSASSSAAGSPEIVAARKEVVDQAGDHTSHSTSDPPDLDALRSQIAELKAELRQVHERAEKAFQLQESHRERLLRNHDRELDLHRKHADHVHGVWKKHLETIKLPPKVASHFENIAGKRDAQEFLKASK